MDDARESPAFVLIDRLLGLGAQVSYHDPHVGVLPRTRRWTRRWPHLPEMRSVELTGEVGGAQDAVLVVTDHGGVDYEMIGREAKLVVDTRGVYREGRENVVKA